MGLSIEAAMSAIAPQMPMGIAFSGGADSTALLVAAARRWPNEVHALHVNHGIQTAAADFELHCERICAQLGVRLHVARVFARHLPGESPEDAARQARYRSLAAMAREQRLCTVALAQHADDQVETLLLALSRGAGLPGLAAMPANFERHGLKFARPLLQVHASSIREWLTQQGMAYLEDPTNSDASFTRNRIRLEVMPALEAALPQFRETFSRSARHAAQAQELLTELAMQDLESMQGGPDIEALRLLPRARQGNLLRHWLRTAHDTSPNTAQLEELLDQVQACRTRGHHIHIKAGKGFVQRSGTRLTFSPSV